MALDRQKKLQQAERLFKQGKVQEALVELENLAQTAPDDLLTLNRMGDLLAKQGRRDEAIHFYSKIATQFSSAGFLPKAVAIHKKILRLDGDCVRSLVALGDLYRQQKLPGEARSYLLKAADVFVQANDFAQARQVYEQLVEAEPSDPRHRARLAEARAAEGETAKAGEDLLGLADSLFHSGKPDDAEKAYRRAMEMMPERDEPWIGIARCFSERGQHAEAAAFLDGAPQELSGSTSLLAERVLIYGADNRLRDAMELLKHPASLEIGDAQFAQFFEAHRSRGEVEKVWEAITPVFARWEEQGRGERLVSLLERLIEIEPGGHLPAMQYRYELTLRGTDQAALEQALRQLVTTYRVRGMEAEAEPLQAQLDKLAPDAKLVAEPAAVSAPVQPSAGDNAALEAEAPAVPLNRSDEEFVDGRMTQAEILEKYGLRDQSAAQIREVIQKFPGHVPAQERWIRLLREESTPETLRDGLVGLALAQRAAGDARSARQTACEAAEVLALEAGQAEILRGFGLTVDSPKPAVAEPVAAEPVVAEPAVAEAVAAVAEPAPAVEPVSTGSSDVDPSSGDGVILIDFDSMDEDDAEVPAAAAERSPEATAPAQPSVRNPGEDMLQEIELCVGRSDLAEARKRIDALLTLGYAGDGLKALEARVAEMERDAQAAEPVVAATDSTDLSDLIVPSEADDDDLSTITAALESELFADDHEAVSPDPESEQSLEEVFAAFKEQVEQEVESDDYRTHYDLGIAYKEMGLMDEAVAEFEHAIQSPDLGREAYTMLAICHRERAESTEAVRCYRQAIEHDAANGEGLPGLRYELAEVLLESGDREGALGEFRRVLDQDPTFRDVQTRVAELEGCAP